MQKSDDVEMPWMRKYVQARLLDRGHDLQHKQKDHAQRTQQQQQSSGAPVERDSREL